MKIYLRFLRLSSSSGLWHCLKQHDGGRAGVQTPAKGTGESERSERDAHDQGMYGGLRYGLEGRRLLSAPAPL